LGVRAELFEAAVAVAGAFGGGGVFAIEVGEDRAHGAGKRVEVQAIEPNFRAARGERVVVIAEPADEVEDVGVAPHPGGEAEEVAERVDGGRVVAGVLDEAVHAVGVGPVGFDGDGGEAFLFDQPAGEEGAVAVELVRAVGGLADEDVAGVADGREEGVVVVVCVVKGVGGMLNYGGNAAVAHDASIDNEGKSEACALRIIGNTATHPPWRAHP
jgi:hypothetical protein